MNELASAPASSIAGPLATAAGVLVALAALAVARWYYNRTLIGKLNDRLFELNKLGVQYPKTARLFFEQANRSQPFFGSAEVDRNDDFYALRAYALFRLNVYEDAFFATQGLWASSTDEGRAWQHYIVQGCRHPLVAEMFAAERRHLGKAFVQFVDDGTLPDGERYRCDDAA